MQDFSELNELAKRGDHRRVDFTGATMKQNVSQTSDMYGCIADDLLMYSFGQATATTKGEQFRLQNNDDVSLTYTRLFLLYLLHMNLRMGGSR